MAEGQTLKNGKWSSFNKILSVNLSEDKKIYSLREQYETGMREVWDLLD